MWTDLKISKDMCVLSQDMALAYNLPFISGKFEEEEEEEEYFIYPWLSHQAYL